MASIRGILNIQSLNELTSENLLPRPAPPRPGCRDGPKREDKSETEETFCIFMACMHAS